MTTIRLALGELRRVTAGRMPLLVTIALILVPLVYGSMYLVTNDDPGKKLNKLPAALVVSDTGAQSGGNAVNVGQDVATALQSARGFDWTRTNPEDAANGLKSGKYTFSLTLPPEFSAALTAPQRSGDQKGLLRLTTSNAQNYLAAPIAESVSKSVRDAVSQEVGPDAANRLLIGFSPAGGQLANAGETAKQLADGASKTRDGAVGVSDAIGKLNATQQQISQQSKQVGDGMTDMTNGLNAARDKANQLPQQAGKIADDTKKAADSGSSFSSAGSQFVEAASGFTGQIDGMSGDIRDELEGKVSPAELNKVLGIVNDAKGKLADANTKVHDTSSQLTTAVNSAKQASSEATELSAAAPGIAKPVSDGATSAGRLVGPAGQARDSAKGAADATSKLVGSSTQLRNDAGSLAGSASQIQQQLTTSPVGEAGKNPADPVNVSSDGVAKASSYTAGLAPFFLALAMWVGAFALFLLLRPLSSRALAARASVWRTAVGGWLPAAAFAVVQAIVVYVTVVFAIGIKPSQPILAAVFLIVVGLSFTALLHGLGALFGSVGRIIGLALLVLQLFTSGGAYPAQTLPGVLQGLNTVLPMGYATDGIRQLCYGGTLTATAIDAGVLVLWGILGLALGMVAARHKRVWTANRVRPELVL
ncbi:YhgE/Pip family protein [Sciscionella marina]|uniref:YhgE/Pip family protein n=1 Tax=Sciscionella marina TaxID=508770 RepID=UPI00037F0884|nr:YhgE/Pip domain-containing protein [Sciscionella marina]